jgi:phosphatidylserine decarboxylase
MARQGWILKEGYPFIALPLALGMFGFIIGWAVLGTIGLLIALAVALFFRNPTRQPPQLRGVALSPADGKVIEVATAKNPETRVDAVWKVSIFMSVFNVHVNRSPVQGEVVEVRHEPGVFRPAYHGETSTQNERNVLNIRMEGGHKVTCVQVAGVLARRIVCWVREGISLERGEPFGMIRFGSRVDCYFPLHFDPEVRPGQRVWGGETILGSFNERTSA